MRRAGSYINSPEWIKNKKATINPQNKNRSCFKYALAVALNHHKIDNHPERVSKLRPYINNYNWSDIYFPVELKEWKKFEKNNESIALNILFVPNDSKDMRLAYKSEYNGKRKEKVILLMICDSEKWYYLAVKN